MSNEPFPLQTNAVMQNAAAATGNGTTLNVSKAQVAVLHVFGTFVGTVTYEATLDGANWIAVTGYTIGGTSGVTTATAAAIVRFNVLGLVGLRARISAYTSGAITVIGNATSGGFSYLATSN